MKKLLLVALLLAWPSLSWAQAVTGLTLINANTNLPIAGYDPIVSGATLNLSTLPTRNLNIRANIAVPAAVGSVVFGLDAAATYATDSGFPYSLAGDNNGTPTDYQAWTPPSGSHTVTARAFSLTGGGGTGGTPLTIQFTVQDSPAVTGYRLRVYIGNPPPETLAMPFSELDVPLSALTCNQPRPPMPQTPPVTNPVTWSWNDPVNVDRKCVYKDARFDGLADGSYSATAASVNSLGVGVESSPRFPFRKSPPASPTCAYGGGTYPVGATVSERVPKPQIPALVATMTAQGWRVVSTVPAQGNTFVVTFQCDGVP